VRLECGFCGGRRTGGAGEAPNNPDLQTALNERFVRAATDEALKIAKRDKLQLRTTSGIYVLYYIRMLESGPWTSWHSLPAF
jgi:hypothetical protein